jgi:hypothetical protein
MFSSSLPALNLQSWSSCGGISSHGQVALGVSSLTPSKLSFLVIDGETNP